MIVTSASGITNEYESPLFSMEIVSLDEYAKKPFVSVTLELE